MSICIGKNVFYLLIVAVVFVLLLALFKNSRKSDSFVGRVPYPSNQNLYPGTQQGNLQFAPPPFRPHQPAGYSYQFPDNTTGSNPINQPMIYKNQYYMGKYPYYADAMRQVGRPCDQNTGCGALGVCQNGVCTVKTQGDTVFDININ